MNRKKRPPSSEGTDPKYEPDFTPFWRKKSRSLARKYRTREALYRKLFDTQFSRFRWHTLYSSVTQEQLSPLVYLGREVQRIGRVPRGHLPFLLVNRSIPIGRQIGSLFDHESKNVTVGKYLDLNQIRHRYKREIPPAWYLLVDVEVDVDVGPLAWLGVGEGRLSSPPWLILRTVLGSILSVLRDHASSVRCLSSCGWSRPRAS